MADFSRLRSLINPDAPEVNEDVQQNPYWITNDMTGRYPQYDQMLQNARDQVIDNQIPSYLSKLADSNKTPDATSGNLPNQSQPNFLDQIGDPSTLPYRQHLHDKSTWLADPKNKIPREQVYNQLAEDYINAVHPEMRPNMEGTWQDYKDYDTKGIHHNRGSGVMIDGIDQAEMNEILNYHRKVGKELTGAEPKNVEFSHAPLREGALADYEPATDTMRTGRPFDFGPSVHEFMHKADREIDPGLYRRHEYLDNNDLKNSNQMATDTTGINNRHILGYLPQQQYTNGHNEMPVGEGAVYFKKLKELLGK